MQLTDFTELRTDVREGVLDLRIARPERRNAWSGRMAVEYRWALHHAHVDPAVRVVVLSGTGSDFCVGADASALDAISSAGGKYAPEELPLPPFPDDAPAEFRRNHLAPLLMSTPVVVAVHGGCAGAGFLLASYGDVRFVAEDARVTTSFARLGLPAEYGLAWLLPRQIGVPNALEMLWTAERYDGPALRRLGWAQRVLPTGEVLDAALAFARQLARHSSAESLRTMKRAVLVDSVLGVGTTYTRSVEDMNAALRHPDMKEGMRALRDKRLPDFLTEGR